MDEVPEAEGGWVDTAEGEDAFFCADGLARGVFGAEVEGFGAEEEVQDELGGVNLE